ncbi:MAG: type II secretion system F family protein, partial [Phycisphaerae bacterium]
TWHYLLLAGLGVAAGAVFVCKSARVKETFGRFIFRIPIFGPAVGSVLHTQTLQLWGAALKSHVPLLGAIQQARDVSKNVVIRELVQRVAGAVQEGRQMSDVLREYAFVPPPVIAAIATGEKTGKLGETIEFIGQWLEEESSALINSLTRMVEPLILVCMGGVVGTVAISLFLPLFELASAA